MAYRAQSGFSSPVFKAQRQIEACFPPPLYWTRSDKRFAYNRLLDAKTCNFNTALDFFKRAEESPRPLVVPPEM